ncbi:M23 family metallopeptidase [Mycobacterium sp. 236(2023)]|uniref:M23 family metallopeptidase n=1 Tax=Mycobacterium sp. 236(2023) TaxID=3038163 RepID=UPI002414F538|nr:M23 family metallopeptidase [Mycobacterium sp. 236(2023)]MDG4663018.1 M23 family metallopeptidase [Mycobacterium sp. 236(2023)]
MPVRPTLAILLLAAALTASCASAPQTTQVATSSSTVPSTDAPPPQGPSVATPLVGRVLSAPIPVPTTDGKTHLAYELLLTNTLAQDVTLASVEVRSGDRSLLTLPRDRLQYWTRILGNPTPTTVLGAAQTATVWLDVALSPNDPVPDQLTHAVSITVPDPMPPLFPGAMTEEVGPVTVQTRTPVQISPPLAGPNWLDGNSCCDMTAHRMALNPINGEIWAAERFAIDYIQLGPDGRMFTGDKAATASYPYFGADILAVGDGPVVSVLDGLPEQVPGVPPTGLALNEYGGNHIVQDLGGGNYAFYAHLQTGSVKVQPGDRLTTGQVIGSLGNTGNSDAPHLHFHVMNGPDPLRSDGLPFVFGSYRLDSRTTADIDPLLDGRPAELEPGFAPRDEKNTSPMVYDVMTYADR